MFLILYNIIKNIASFLWKWLLDITNSLFLAFIGMFNIKNIEIEIKGQADVVDMDNANIDNIEQIQVEGEAQKQVEPMLTIEAIKSLSGLNIGDNMFQKSKKEITDSIKTNYYVEDVQINRKFNGTMHITIIPREVSYLINYAGTYIYLDSQGYILELNSEVKNVPILIGTTTDFANLGLEDNNNEIKRLNSEDLEKLDKANDIMDCTKSNNVSDLINTLDITDDKNYTLHIDAEQKVVYLGDCKDLNTRILYMKSILEKEKGNKGEIYINADLDKGYVYFKETV